MKNGMLQRMVAVGTMAIASLALTTAARAELVSYDFTAKVTGQYGANVVGTAGSSYTGMFTYDTKTFDLTIDKLAQNNLTTSSYISLEYNGKMVTAGETNNIIGTDGSYSATLQLTGQQQLPSSLSLAGGGAGTLNVSGYLTSKGSFSFNSSLTSLTVHGSASTPELDPRSGAGALGLLLGSLGMVFARRRSSK